MPERNEIEEGRIIILKGVAKACRSNGRNEVMKAWVSA